MSGISKIVDERIEQLRREKIELDILREKLNEREAALTKREEARGPASAPPEGVAAPVPLPPVPRQEAVASPPAAAPPAKRGRGRPKKGEAPAPSVPGQSELARMRAALFAELTALEEQKITLLEETQAQKTEIEREIAALEQEKAARQTEINNELARFKLQKMTELERELEAYRAECFASAQGEYRRQLKIAAQNAPAAEYALPAEEPPPAAEKRGRGRPRKAPLAE